MKKNLKKSELEEKLKIAYLKKKELKNEGATEKDLRLNDKKVQKLINKLDKVNSKTSSNKEQETTYSTLDRKKPREVYSKSKNDFNKSKSNNISGYTPTKKIKANEKSNDFSEDDAIDKIIVSDSMILINQFVTNEKRLNVLEAAEYKLLILKIH